MTAVAVTNTFASGATITASGHNTNFTDLVNYINNRNNGSATWDACYVTTASAVPVVVNNSTGANAIANFQDNGTTRVSLLDGGGITLTGATPATPAVSTIYAENIPKGFIKFNGTAGTVTTSFNVTSITHNGTGDYTITWNTDFVAADYVAVISSDILGVLGTMAAGSLQVRTLDTGSTPLPVANTTYVCVAAFGNQV